MPAKDPHSFDQIRCHCTSLFNVICIHSRMKVIARFSHFNNNNTFSLHCHVTWDICDVALTITSFLLQKESRSIFFEKSSSFSYPEPCLSVCLLAVLVDKTTTAAAAAADTFSGQWGFFQLS